MRFVLRYRSIKAAADISQLWVLFDWLIIFLDSRFPPTCHAQFPCSLDLMTRERWTSFPSFISLHPISLLVVVLDYSLRSQCFDFRRAGWTLRSKRTLPRKKTTLMRRLRRSECLLIHQILLITRLFSLPLACLLCRDTARLIIRKIQYAPTQVGAGPKAEICKNFMMSDKPVQMEASLEKDVRYPNENVLVFPQLCHIIATLTDSDCPVLVSSSISMARQSQSKSK